MKIVFFRSLVVLLAASVITACSLRQPAVLTEEYDFDLPTPKALKPNSRSVAVLPFTASPAAAGQMFLYRADRLRYESDYYNRFLAPPERLLTDALRRWLMKARVGEVREPGAPLDAELIIQPRLSEMYADYRDVARPRAVMSVIVVLICREPTGNRQIFERTYRHEVPMKNVSPTAAVKGWSEAAEGIFAEVTRDISAVN
jgi:ABC-type uncharacterized transport system auxiliary subunit